MRHAETLGSAPARASDDFERRIIGSRRHHLGTVRPARAAAQRSVWPPVSVSGEDQAALGGQAGGPCCDWRRRVGCSFAGSVS